MSKKTTTPAPTAPATQRECAAAWLQAKTAAGRAKHHADAASRTKLGFKRLAAAMEAGDRALVEAWAVDADTKNALKAARRAKADAPVKAPAKAPKGKAKSRKAGAKAPAKAPASYADAETAALAYAALVKAGAGSTAAAADALAFLTRR